MSHSNRLRLSEVRRVFRLLGDVRDLKHDQMAQEKLIADTLVELVGADHGFAARFEHFRLNAPLRITQWVPGVQQDPTLIWYLTEFAHTTQYYDDPMSHLCLDLPGQVITAARSRLLPDDEWARYPIFTDLVSLASIRDILVAYFRYPNSNSIRGYSLHRTHRNRKYSDRDIRLAQLFCKELHQLYLEGKLEPLADCRLTRRQQQLVARLVKGRSPQRIAAELGLSVTTVRTYLRDLYQRVDVSGRDELIARLLSPNPPAGRTIQSEKKDK